MAFRIHDVTIHLTSRDDDAAPCTMLSGGGGKPCDETSYVVPPCQGKSEKPRPRPKPKSGEDEKRNLASLQARLRETLAPPTL